MIFCVFFIFFLFIFQYLIWGYMGPHAKWVRCRRSAEDTRISELYLECVKGLSQKVQNAYLKQSGTQDRESIRSDIQQDCDNKYRQVYSDATKLCGTYQNDDFIYEKLSIVIRFFIDNGLQMVIPMGAYVNSFLFIVIGYILGYILEKIKK